MTISTIKTVFTVIPAGAKVTAGGLLLSARVLVEWLLPQNVSAPSWLTQWPPKDMAFDVVLETTAGPISQVRHSISADQRQIDAAALRAGNDARSAGFSGLKTLSVKPIMDEWVANSMQKLINSQPVASEDGVAKVRQFLQETHFGVSDGLRAFGTSPVVDDFVSSRAVTRYPMVGIEHGLMWEINLLVPQWEQYVDKRLDIQCIPTFAESDVITPYTACVIRRIGEQVSWFPMLGNDETLTSQGSEGLIRMQPENPGGLLWFLETAEYVAAALQGALGKQDSATLAKPMADTGGIALCCSGIENIFKEITHPTDGGSHPTVRWSHLVCGFRVDVLTDDSSWHSIMGRTVELNGSAVFDEGVIELGAIAVPGSNVGWKTEEVGRWDGGCMISSATEEIYQQKLAVKPRPDPNCRLRWEHVYAMGLRPVFKGGWSLSVEDAAHFRSAAGNNLFATQKLKFKREERIHQPEIEGLVSKENVHRINCSTADGQVPSMVRLTLHPPSVRRALIKRSGVLDKFSSPEEQARELRRAAAIYGDKQHLEDAFLDPWANELRLEATLLGTPASSCSPITSDQAALLTRGETKVASIGWNCDWPHFDEIRFDCRATTASRLWQKGRHVGLELAPGDRCLVELFSVAKELTLFAHSGRLKPLLQAKVAAGPQLDMKLVRCSSDRVSLDVRHVTNEPLEDPRLTTPRVERAIGQLESVIYDVVQTDRQTTSQLVAVAQWNDWEKSTTQGPMFQTEKTLQSRPVLLDDDSPSDYGEAGETIGFAEVAFSLPFSDFRRRDLSLKVVATPRYGDLFGEAARERIGPSVHLIVPNAKVPTTPTVNLVLPLMRVLDTSTSEAEGGHTWRQDFYGKRIRIYLGPDWYETGPNEMLGVVCAPESQDALADSDRRANKQYFSQWGAEVLLATQPISPGPFTRHFPLRSFTFDGVSSKPGAHESGKAAVVACHSVQYDVSAGHYYADVAVAGYGSPYSWLRMVLARVQPESVEGTHISPTLNAQFTQLLPNRWMTVSDSPTSKGALRVAAAKTKAEESSGSARLSATVTLLRRWDTGSKLPTDQFSLLFDGHPWHSICQIPMRPHDSLGAAHWLGQIEIPKTGSLAVLFREYFTPPNQEGAPILRWETAMRIER